jgi:hypothetical protein
MPGFVRPDTLTAPPLMSFPGGNSAIARYFVRRLIPGALDGDTLASVVATPLNRAQLDHRSNAVRIRLDATAVRVENTGRDGVTVTYTEAGRLHRVRGRVAVMASGGWVNRRIIRDLPQAHVDAYATFQHAPVLVVNVALRHWRFLAKLGVAGAIWSGGFGFSCNIARPMVAGRTTPPLDPDKPVTLTFYARVPGPGATAAARAKAGARSSCFWTGTSEFDRARGREKDGKRARAVRTRGRTAPCMPEADRQHRQRGGGGNAARSASSLTPSPFAAAAKSSRGPPFSRTAFMSACSDTPSCFAACANPGGGPPGPNRPARPGPPPGPGKPLGPPPPREPIPVFAVVTKLFLA